MNIVNDFNALITDLSWTDRTDGTPRVVTYSYLNVSPAYQYGGSYSDAFLNSLQPFTQSDRAQMEDAIAQMSANAGLVFVEVEPGKGDINIANYDFNLDTASASDFGFAYYPNLHADGTGSWYSELGGDIFINTSSSHSVHLMLHELGHAVGLKHPFDGDPILPSSLDNIANTVMSYTGLSTGFLGPFDIDALQFLYGNSIPAPGTLEYWLFNPTMMVLTQNWGNAASVIHGVFGDDRITAGPGDDWVAGHPGNDILDGEDGDDVLLGGDGNDILHGRGGDDRLLGEGGNDVLLGDAGADNLNGGLGIDRAAYWTAGAAVRADLQVSGVNTGEAQGDTYTSIENLQGTSFNDDLRGDYGANILWGGNGNDTIHGRGGNDILFGQGGNDVLLGNIGADDLNGGLGVDRAAYWTAGAGIRADLQFAHVNTGDAQGDTYASIDNLQGTNFNDDLRGNNAANTVWGSNGNDTIHGRGGIDVLIGGNGNDVLLGGPGADVLNGGAGTDRAAYFTATAAVRADLQFANFNTGEAAGDTYILIENLQGTNVNDDLRGNNAANTIWGGNGNDTIDGRGGDDTLLGQGGNDRFVFQNGFGINTITDFDEFNALEKIDLSAVTNITDFADLNANHMAQNGANVEITDGLGIITVLNALKADMDASNFLF